MGPSLGAAQPTPTPTIPDIFPSASPSPTPKPSSRPTEDRPPEETESPEPGEEKRDKEKRKTTIPDPLPGERVAGAFNTLELMGAAAQLRALGWTEEATLAAVFPPFIVAGYASWSDTWNAFRYGPGPLVRRHEGQDVFCDLGAPVIAPEQGVVEFEVQSLGGNIARLHRLDGTYFYFAHLLDWNTEQWQSGDVVPAGAVIGYCGRTGNAELTPPHVHFGWYGPSGSRNPMLALITWLETAEKRAADLILQVTGDRIARISELETYRRFGDEFAPDRSELPNHGEALWAVGSVPVTGALGIVEVALQRALAPSAPGPLVTDPRSSGAVPPTTPKRPDALFPYRLL